MSLRLPYNNETKNYFNLNLNDNYIGTIYTGITYLAKFNHEQTDSQFSSATIDSSLYPDKYNRFYLTTQLTGTSVQNVAFDAEGWYKYEFYLWSDRDTQLNRLGFGQCYVYDSVTNAENTPTKSTYQEDKKKYVYKK